MRVFKDKPFDLTDRPVRIRLCDHPSCGQAGDYRAPKNRDRLNEYYFFCLEHVRAYNKAWDFLSGLSSTEIETYMREATVWERPSWPLGQWGLREQKLRDKALHGIFGDPPEEKKGNEPEQALSLAERDALTILELRPPVTFAAIKGQYRTLVKKHHPDMNGGCSENEERFKNISIAFTTLRKIYEA